MLLVKFQISDILRSQTSVGKRHRDHAVTGNVVGQIGSALTTYFFGPKGDKKLTVKQFTEFQAELQREVLKLEVNLDVYLKADISFMCLCGCRRNATLRCFII